MDALGALQNIIQVAMALKEIYEGVKANKEKCRQLVERIEGIIGILKSPGVQAKLKGHSVPKVFVNLQRIITDTRDFITKYGVSKMIIKVVSWQSINERFEELNTMITQCVGDCNLLLTVEIHEAVTIQEKESTAVDLSLKKGADVMAELNNDNETSLLLWVDHKPENNLNVKRDLAKISPNTAIIECISTENMKSIFIGNRSLRIDCPGRFRIITNRTRPGLIDPKVYNERSAHDVVDFIKEMGLHVPVLIYTSYAQNVINLNNELGKGNSYVVATSSPNVVVNFALMSTILFVWQNMDDHTKSILDFYQQNGCCCSVVDSRDRAMAYLSSNMDLKSNKRFRIVVTRFGVDLIKEIRSLGFDSIVMVYTSNQNLPDAKQRFDNITRTVITSDEEIAKNFGLMNPLFGDIMDGSNLKLSDPFKDLSLNPPVTSSPINPHTSNKINNNNLNLSGSSNSSSPKKSTWINIDKNSIGTFTASKISCNNLYPKDKNGLSDPYVVFKCLSKESKTFTVMKNLNPVFSGSTCQLADLKATDTIIVEVWDWDQVGGDDFEGQIEMNVSALIDDLNRSQTRTNEYSLLLTQRPGKKEKVSGKINFEATWMN